MKKVFLIIFSCILVVLLCILGYFLYKYFTPITLNSIDNSFSITIPGKVKLKTRESTDGDYKLDVYSIKDEMFLNSTVFELQHDIDLLDAVSNEKSTLSTSRQIIGDISDTSEIAIKDYNAYKYSYTYHDSDYNDDIYAEIVWIKTKKSIYILDFEVILKNKDKYIPIFASIANSFTEN